MSGRNKGKIYKKSWQEKPKAYTDYLKDVLKSRPDSEESRQARIILARVGIRKKTRNQITENDYQVA